MHPPPCKTSNPSSPPLVPLSSGFCLLHSHVNITLSASPVKAAAGVDKTNRWYITHKMIRKTKEKKKTEKERMNVTWAWVRAKYSNGLHVAWEPDQTWQEKYCWLNIKQTQVCVCVLKRIFSEVKFLGYIQMTDFDGIYLDKKKIGLKKRVNTEKLTCGHIICNLF